jgi:hypothetical protein
MKPPLVEEEQFEELEKDTLFKLSNENKRKPTRISSLYTWHENLNLQVSTYLNPKPPFLGGKFLISSFYIYKNMNLKQHLLSLSLIHGCLFILTIYLDL